MDVVKASLEDFKSTFKFLYCLSHQFANRIKPIKKYFCVMHGTTLSVAVIMEGLENGCHALPSLSYIVTEKEKMLSIFKLEICFREQTENIDGCTYLIQYIQRGPKA